LRSKKKVQTRTQAQKTEPWGTLRVTVMVKSRRLSRPNGTHVEMILLSGALGRPT
jgi:hypothetical protein